MVAVVNSRIIKKIEQSSSGSIPLGIHFCLTFGYDDQDAYFFRIKHRVYSFFILDISANQEETWNHLNKSWREKFVAERAKYPILKELFVETEKLTSEDMTKEDDNE